MNKKKHKKTPSVLIMNFHLCMSVLFVAGNKRIFKFSDGTCLKTNTLAQANDINTIVLLNYAKY